MDRFFTGLVTDRSLNLRHHFVDLKSLLFLIPILLWTSISAVFSQTYTPPDCYGGMREFRHFFEKMVEYPEAALANKEKGDVVIFFIINPNGTTRNLKIWESAGEALDAEAMRIFRLLLWVPATYDEEKKAAEHLITFHFSPKRYRSICKRRGYDRLPKHKHPVDRSVKIHDLKLVSKAPEVITPNGDNDIVGFFSKNLHHPHPAIRNGLHGRVKLWFVVETNGLISNVQIRRSVGGGCNEEAIRLLHQLRWEPGLIDGKAIRTEMYLVVNFAKPHQQDVSKIPAIGGTVH